MAMKLVSLDYLQVGNAPEQVRRNLSLNNTTSTIRGLSGQRNTRKLGEMRDGIEMNGKEYFDTNEAKRLFRDIAGFDSEAYVPTITLGNKSSGYRYLKDGNDIYRFMAVLEQDNGSLRSSTSLRILVSGYTDRSQLDHNRMPDPETIMHINSITTLRVTYGGGLGGYDRYEVIDNNMVILPDVYNKASEKFSAPSTFLEYVESHDDGIEDIGLDLIVDAHGNRAKTIRHNMSSPDSYFKTIARADFIANGDRDSMEGVANANYDTAPMGLSSFTQPYLANNNYDRTVRNNTFYEAFSDAAENPDVARGIFQENAFTLIDLLDACSIKERNMPDYIFVREFENLDYDANRWNGANEETMAAYDVCHRIPEYMLNNLILGCSFEISNRYSSNRNGRVTAEFSFLGDVNDRGNQSYNIVPLTGSGDIPNHFLETFENNIISDVFEPLSDYGEIPMTMTVYSSLAGLTKIDINIDDGQNEPYVFTSFCEHRLNNNLTRWDDKNFGDTIRNYSAIRGEIKVANMVRNSKSFDSKWADNQQPTLTGMDDRKFFGDNGKSKYSYNSQKPSTGGYKYGAN